MVDLGDTNKWREIDRLKAEFSKDIGSFSQPKADDGGATCESDHVIRLIEEKIQECVECIGQGESPVLSHANRSTWANMSFDKVKGVQLAEGSSKTSVRFDSVLSVNKFALTIRVMSLIHELLQRNVYCTKRDLYYQAPQLFGSQSIVDSIVDNISCMLSVPRWHLHVLATSKGCLAGDLQYVEMDGNYVDCRQTSTGVLVPTHVSGITNILSKAKFVLVVEKDATFQSLMENEVCKKLEPCIIVTGKGFPDMNTRLMVRKLWNTFHLPTLLLVDADPHGIEIMAIYKYGSRSLSFESSNLTVPSVKWLGLLPTDITRLNIPGTGLLCMTQSDRDKAQELLQRSFMKQHPGWKTQVELMLSTGIKAELQSLSAISSTFLTDVYLPNKIQFGGWL